MLRNAKLPHKQRPIRIFVCSCGHEQYCNELEEHLSLLQRQGLVTIRQSHKIPAGLVLEDEIINCIDTADIILLCVSVSLFSDEYSDIMDLAMDLSDEGEVRVVPILVSPVAYRRTPIGKLQILPKWRGPLALMKDRPERDGAYVEISDEIDLIVQDLQECMSGKENVPKMESDEQSSSDDTQEDLER